MASTTLQSVVCSVVPGLSGQPDPTDASSFPTDRCGLPPLPAPFFFRSRVHPLVNSIRLQSSFSRSPARARCRRERLPWGLVPHHDISSRSPLADGVPRSRLCSARSVSHALDGLLLPAPCALVSSRSRVQGSRSRGFFPPLGRITSSVTVTLAPLAPSPAGCPAPANVASTSGSCSEPWSAVPTGVFSSVRHPIPSCVFNSCGHAPGDLGSAVAPPPLTTSTTRDCVSPASLAPSVSIDLRAVASVPRGPSRSSFPAFELVALPARPIGVAEPLSRSVDGNLL